MRILVTGFDPFGGEKINPAYEAVKLLPDIINGAEIIKSEIPTVFSRSSIVMENKINEVNPDVIINVGQAGGRSCVTIEKVAINYADARIPDNDGEQPLDEELQKDGETAYFATIPINAMVENIRKHGIPSSISYTAGTYVCNSIMYNVLYMISKKYKGIKAGFIHVPYVAEQVVDKPYGTPFISMGMIEKALEYAIEIVAENCHR